MKKIELEYYDCMIILGVICIFLLGGFIGMITKVSLESYQILESTIITAILMSVGAWLIIQGIRWKMEVYYLVQ